MKNVLVGLAALAFLAFALWLSQVIAATHPFIITIGGH